jgi:multidrug efflux system membrane fusion protein
VVVDGADKLREGSVVEMVVRDNAPPREGGRRKRAEKGAEKGSGDQAAQSPEERLKRWQELNARIDKGEFGEEIRKLPEEERKQRMREMRGKKQP